jgi:hypothetical protein
MSGVSFDIFLQRFKGGDAGRADEATVLGVLEPSSTSEVTAGRGSAHRTTARTCTASRTPRPV